MPSRYETPVKAVSYAQNITIPSKQIEVYRATENPVSYQTVQNTTTTGGGKSYFVQAGAFSKQNSAHDLSQKLTQFGKTNVSSVDVGGKTFYRVRLGPFNQPEEAEVTLAKVRNYGIQNASMIQD